MALTVIDAKHRIKRSTIPGVVPVIGTSDDHTDGSWTDEMIYSGEFFVNLPDEKVWIGTNAIPEEIALNKNVKNFAVSDLMVTGDRIHDLDGYSIDLVNGVYFAFSTSLAPSGGNSSFDIQGYGVSNSDKSFRVSTDAGLAMEVLGDKTVRVYERMQISTPAGASYGLDIIADSDYAFQITNTGTSGLGIAASFNGNSNFRVLSATNNKVGIGNGIEGTAAYVGVFGFGGTYGLAGQGVNGGLAYSTGGGWGFQAWKSAGIGALKTDGKVNFINLDATNIGLSIGDLYMDTAANILANGDLMIGIKQ